MTPEQREHKAAEKAERIVRDWLWRGGCFVQDMDAATCAALATALQAACARAGIVDWKRYVASIGVEE